MLFVVRCTVDSGVATLNVSAEIALPNWVRGRGLAMYITVMFGAITIGSAIGVSWRTSRVFRGRILPRSGIVLAIPLTWRWTLPAEGTLDLTPSMRWPARVISRAIAAAMGRYSLPSRSPRRRSQARLFLNTLVQRRQERLRDVLTPGAHLKTPPNKAALGDVFVSSWTEHLRQNDRVTNADAFYKADVIAVARGANHNASHRPRLRGVTSLDRDDRITTI